MSSDTAGQSITRVCVVAPFEPLRAGLVSTLEETPDIEVLAATSTLGELVAMRGFKDADVTVIDSQALGGAGAEAAAYSQINEWLPALRILFIGTPEDTRNIRPEHIPAYMRLHTVGFLLKDGPTSRLVDAVRLVASGTFVCETDLIRHILTRLTQWASYSAEEPSRNGQQLSDRETEVLALVARGMSNKEIAGELFLSEGTVKAHVSHIMAKLAVDRRTDLVRHAFSTGLIPLTDEGENGGGARRSPASGASA
jgi:DNA-binding NarL/FixJ family response regulator